MKILAFPRRSLTSLLANLKQDISKLKTINLSKLIRQRKSQILYIIDKHEKDTLM